MNCTNFIKPQMVPKYVFIYRRNMSLQNFSAPVMDAPHGCCETIFLYSMVCNFGFCVNSGRSSLRLLQPMWLHGTSAFGVCVCVCVHARVCCVLHFTSYTFVYFVHTFLVIYVHCQFRLNMRRDPTFCHSSEMV
jgi:hypothetical protein